MWVNRQFFSIIEGTLYRADPEDRGLQLVVLQHLREEVLRQGRDIPTAGHQGINRTKERLQRYWWYRCRSHFRRYVKTLLLNLQLNEEKCQAGTAAPLDTVLCKLSDGEGASRFSEYVLMIVDQFTKWVECLPLPSQTVEVTEAVREFFSRFGCPLQIFTDQGRNFESNLFKLVCESLNINKSRTTPYHQTDR
ncbi:gypsy retrotransposon integrase 1-like protein [Plakobranchus ocellatus]|uniref:Gypsy retrotransposon integrase 1-like protein n=1 Tax=Plakobranchus ocellatus TaxID=259542 RepID=A0AAV4DR80_9GAST|nr:gypsy retrotransposon integrase 1-like protein [Plakobranchus ocellatus]